MTLLGGCDLAFGVEGDPGPCDLGTFNSAQPKHIAPAIAFSVDWDQTYAVLLRDDSTAAEMTLPSGEPQPIDLGPYAGLTLSLAPEGTALLYTASLEPLTLQGALRSGPKSWRLGARTPVATWVGTSSADVFGPRRILARMNPVPPLYESVDDQVVELEDQNGTWVRVGDAHALVSTFPPNLTPNGLTAVFARSTSTDAGIVSEIYGMTRPSTDVWFDTPVKILENKNDDMPQLLGNCSRLYSIHHDTTEGLTELLRYDR